MGQYYRALFLNDKNNKPFASVRSYDFGNGAKLMEHSWIGNPFVSFVENQLINQAQPIVWAGDYADKEDPKTLTKDDLKPHVDEKSDYWNLKVLTKEGINLYHLCENVGVLTHGETVKDKYSHNFPVTPKRFKYLVNYDKGEFVDKTKVPDVDGWRIHPLPLLTCEGNGRGGGDFHGESDLIGRWSRDRIGVTSKKSDIPNTFKEIIFDLIESQ